MDELLNQAKIRQIEREMRGERLAATAERGMSGERPATARVSRRAVAAAPLRLLRALLLNV